MAVPKVCGIETEYGIVLRGGDSNPIMASSILVNAYVQTLGRNDIAGRPSRVSWDFEDESPGIDARGFTAIGAMPPEVETHLVNAVLTYGARFYVDHAHPEYSSPECRTALSATLFDRAGELVLLKSMEAARRSLPPGQEIVVYKNNSDGKGNSYGYHESYLMSRTVPFERIVKVLAPFFVTRPIFAGAGKVGAENETSRADYQISQRADFFECLVDLNTMVRRPIVNSRDEPHAEHAKYRRLHVIVGDANMAELSTYLKVGTLSIVLDLLDAGADVPQIELEDPVQGIKQVSRDVTMKEPLRLAGGRSTTAVAIQRAYLKAAMGYYACHDLSQVTKDILVRWEDVLDKLEQDPRLLVRELDWVAKRQMMESYMERKGCGWDDSRIRLMDLQYHDVRPDKGLYFTLERSHLIERIVQEAEIARAEFTPPPGTRAYFRGRCVSKFTKSVYGASWTSVLFDVGNKQVKRVPLMDPLRGTASLTSDLLDQVDTVDALLAKLKA